MTRWSVLLTAGLATLGCNPEANDAPRRPAAPLSQGAAPAAGPASGPDTAADAPKEKTIQAPVAAEQAPAASPRLAGLPPLDTLKQAAKTYFEGHVGRRIYVQVDKPLYTPGEDIWVKTWDLQARDLLGAAGGGRIKYELVSPKGAVVLEKWVEQAGGTATNDFTLPESVQGGEYIVRARSDDGVQGERTIIVSSYEAPRVKKKLEFVRKAYGAGDTVTATIEVKRATAEVLANHPLRAQIMLDGALLPEVALTTNADGNGLVKFTLPGEMAKGDGLLTVLVDDGGVTESVSKSVPIILKKVQLAFFPEGGTLVQGQPSRLYFEAKNMIDKPADVAGKVVDDKGNTVATFESYKNGLGRFDFTPNTGRTYHAEITRPVGVTEHHALPVAEEKGCVLRVYDDLDGQRPETPVAVQCTEARKVVVVGVLRENVVDAAAVEVKPDTPTVVYLTPEPALARARGILRVTLLDEALQPLAERIVMRNRRAGLDVKIEADQTGYVPREQVALKVTTRDAEGKPVPAELALAVVDDTVISFADDKKGHLLSKVLLEPEVPGEVEEPNFYFDLKEDKSALAMDLLMGTRGWRRFEWQPVISPPPPTPVVVDALEGNLFGDEIGEARGFGGLGLRGVGRGGGGVGEGAIGLGNFKAAGRGAGPGRPMAARPQRRLEVAGAVAAPAPPPKVEGRKMAPPMNKVVAGLDRAPAAPADPAAREAPMAEAAADIPARGRLARQPMGAAMPARDLIAADAKADKDWANGEMQKAKEQVALAPVRVFPAPNYAGDFQGARTDFRQTIHWAPAVRTGKDGSATVTFHLSDAITSFRVFAEGMGGGTIGRTEEVIKSSLPFSMAIKLPLEVSQGDTLELPLILSNEQDKDLPVSLSASFGDLLTLEHAVALDGPALPAKARKSLYYPVKVTGAMGRSKVSIGANAGGLTDEFEREVLVTPLGFPQLEQRAGTLSDVAQAEFDLADASEGSITASIKLYPSPVSTLVGGLEGLIQQPSGCFEQTSSTNYPNVMVLKYLQAHDVADPALVARTQDLLDQGYKRLTGYETKNKGYEWFGSVPAHEALTAYGVVEFVDMKGVYGEVDEAMLGRTVDYLKSRRNGKGGYLRDGKALDSFGRASPEVTDAYITYSVAEAGLTAGFEKELEAAVEVARTAQDPYILALAATTLTNLPTHAADAQAAINRLADMQKPEGPWAGANHSITRSSGINLDIETTSLAILALMKVGGHEDKVRAGVEWLQKNRSGYGQWGATQATVLALKAMTEYAVRTRATPSDGSVTLVINGNAVDTFQYAAGRREPIEFTNLSKHFQKGKNTVELRHKGEAKLPYTMAVDFRAENPATHPEVVVGLTTALARDTVKMGENVRLTAVVENHTAEGQPMTLVRVGLPGGLTFQTWQLKALKDKGLIAFYETRPREVILYFRELAPKARLEIPIDLVALVPGTYTAPASSGYLYYTDDKKVWASGLKVTVTR